MIFTSILALVSTETQAGVAILAFALRTFFPRLQLFLLLITVLLVVLLIILEVATFLLVAFETCSVLVANELDNGSLIETLLCVVIEGKATTVESCSNAVPPNVGVRLGIAELLEFSINLTVVVGFVSSGDVDGLYCGVFCPEVELFSNRAN